MTTNERKQATTSMCEAIQYNKGMIKEVSKEIYENITQCLCLARLQLGNIDLDNKQTAMEVIGEANLLIGKAVKDLRNLAKQLSTGNK